MQQTGLGNSTRLERRTNADRSVREAKRLIWNSLHVGAPGVLQASAEARGAGGAPRADQAAEGRHQPWRAGPLHHPFLHGRRRGSRRLLTWQRARAINGIK